jgi:hypothetical protein
MKTSIAAAACLEKRALDALIESRALSPSDVRAVKALRGNLGRRLLDGEITAVNLTKRDHQEEEQPVELTSTEKRARTADWIAALERDAIALAKRERISNATAQERVMSAQVMLEKLDREHMAKLGGGSLPQKSPGSMLEPFNQGTEWPAEGPTFQELLHMLTTQFQIGGMSKQDAVTKAMQDPRLKKMLDTERNARLQAASRIYG